MKHRRGNLIRAVAVAALAAIGLTFNVPGGAALAGESPDAAILFAPPVDAVFINERAADGSKRPPGLAGLHPCARASPWRYV